MLITLSGMVGSGKSTAAAHVMRILEEHGQQSRSLRFQSLPCFTWLRRDTKEDAAPAVPVSSSATPARLRWKGYRPKRLGFLETVVYLLRIVLFRVYRRLRWERGVWYICDRYFYDVFVHYHLTSRSERLFYGLLRACIPSPDVALLLTAPPERIAMRRPDYSPEYLDQVTAAYGGLTTHFPSLIEIASDQDGASLLATAVERAVAKR